MKKRQWTSEQKLQIVMQGAGGRAVSEICNEYQINQSQYYLWHDQFLQNAGRVFEIPKTAQQQSRLERENEKLKAMVGELRMELKKKRLVKHLRRRALFRTSADALSARADTGYQAGTSVLGLSQSLGLPQICCRLISQSKARLSSFERKHFTGQSRDAPFGKTNE